MLRSDGFDGQPSVVPAGRREPSAFLQWTVMIKYPGDGCIQLLGESISGVRRIGVQLAGL